MGAYLDSKHVVPPSRCRQALQNYSEIRYIRFGQLLLHRCVISDDMAQETLESSCPSNIPCLKGIPDRGRFLGREIC